MNRHTTKIQRSLHDAQATLFSVAGKKAKGITNHAKIIQSSVAVQPSESILTNELENIYISEDTDVFLQQPELKLLEIENVWVTGAQGHLFLEPHKYLHICRSFNGISDKKIRRPIPALAHRVKDPIFVLCGRGLGNRGHFLVEHLPRLLASREKLPPGTKIMVPPKQKRWAKGYLAKLGIAEDDIIESSEGTILLDRAFYIPLFSADAKARLAPKKYYEQLREAFIQPASGQRESIFISRKDADSRIMLNEDKIFETASKLIPNLQRVSMSALSLDEQIALFANAEVVLGAHSQAFRNLMFCSNALCIQLVNGNRNEENEYFFWANNYSQLGSFFDNGCVSLYSETSLDTNWNWMFPIDKFSKDLDHVLKLWKK